MLAEELLPGAFVVLLELALWGLEPVPSSQIKATSGRRIQEDLGPDPGAGHSRVGRATHHCHLHNLGETAAIQGPRTIAVETSEFVMARGHTMDSVDKCPRVERPNCLCCQGDAASDLDETQCTAADRDSSYK